MSPEAQRIAIAEECGFVWYRIPKARNDGPRRYRFLALPSLQEYEGQSDIWKERADSSESMSTVEFMEENGFLPAYLEHSNAMHDACATLAAKGWRCVANMGTDGSWEAFFTKRDAADCSVVIPQEGDHYGAGLTLAEALSEAFLRVFGKWIE